MIIANVSWSFWWYGIEISVFSCRDVHLQICDPSKKSEITCFEDVIISRLFLSYMLIRYYLWTQCDNIDNHRSEFIPQFHANYLYIMHDLGVIIKIEHMFMACSLPVCSSDCPPLTKHVNSARSRHDQVLISLWWVTTTYTITIQSSQTAEIYKERRPRNPCFAASAQISAQIN